MKLDQIIDKASNQNEVESKYLWNSHPGRWINPVDQIDLSTLTIEFSETLSDFIYIKHCQALPNNRLFYVDISQKLDEDYSQQFNILDSNFNIKTIKPPISEVLYFTDTVSLVSCFYDDSIFLYEYDWVVVGEDGYNPPHWFKRYNLLENRWINLAHPPLHLATYCIGLNQKILLADAQSGIWVYDIILDSFSQFFSINIEEDSWKMLIKNAGKIYLITQPNLYKIYSCDENLSDWTLVYNSKIEPHHCDEYCYNVYYDGSLFYLSNSALYRFNFKKLKSKELKSWKENYEIEN